MTVVRSATTAVVLTAVAAFAQLPASRPAANFSIESDAAMVTIAVRPERAPAFDAVLDKLKSALMRSKNPQRRAQAAGWQMFKSEETVQGNLTYLMRLDPAVPGSDYEWGRIIAEEFPSDEGEVNRVLREAVVTRSVLPLSPVAVPGLGEPGVMDEAEGRPYTEPRVPVLSFDTAQAVVITVLVRSTREPEFISTLEYLGKALRASATRRRQARGWHVFKSSQMFSENNVAYVMSLDPVVNRAEYDLIRLIQEAFPGEVDAIFGNYREAFTGRAVSRLTNRIEMAK